MQAPLLWFLWEETGKAGEADFGLANLDNFIRLWGTGAVPGCLVLDHGAIRSTALGLS